MKTISARSQFVHSSISSIIRFNINHVSHVDKVYILLSINVNYILISMTSLSLISAHTEG